MIKRFVIPSLYIFFCALIFLSVGCQKKSSEQTIKVAATAIPHAQMLEEIRDDLQKKGYELKIVEVQDYNVPNRALTENEVDANFFQHIAFMEEQIKQFDYSIKCYAKIHLEPMAIYSKKYRSLKALPKNAKIAVPNDPTNEYRALQLLEKAGLISIRENVQGLATVKDISSNPNQFKILEVDAAMIPRSLADVDAAVINANFALQAGLDPKKDSLMMEGKGSYVNIIAIRDDEENEPKLKALREAMLSEKMRTFILKKYQGEIIPILEECN